MRPQRLRILRVVARLNVGGPALHVSLLSARLDPARFETVLAAGTPEAGEGEMLDLRPSLRDELGDRLVLIPGLRRALRPLDDARALTELLRLIGRFRPHIVHTHTAKAGLLGRVAARLRRVPVVVHTFHGTVFEGHFGPSTARAIVATERTLARVTDQIVTVSQSVADDLEARGIGRGRVRVVPLGLDLAPFAAVPPLDDHVPSVVTLVGRLAPVKDVPLFIEAMRLVREKHPEIDVRIAGDGPLRGELEASAPSWVRFLGNHADLPGLLAETGVVALSSHSEGTPVALIEALAAARPVVAVPATGGVVDVLGGRPGALVTHRRDARSLADGVLTALKDQAMARAAATGRTSVLADFGAARLVSDIETLYEELWASERRRATRGD